MTVGARVIRRRYVDSVVLMRLAERLAALDGVADAAAMMGTDANKAVLAEGGFTAEETSSAAADDLVIAVKADDNGSADAALARADEFLSDPQLASASSTSAPTMRTLADALAAQPGLNLAAISLPGEYAAAEAKHALERGLNVFLFSSNVELADEMSLKRLASQHGLLCMGPDCGTAIIAGKGLGFANAVRPGPIGIVGASGTGIQALTCLLDRFGVGVSHAIGCGSRDLSEHVGGQTALAGLDALLADTSTEAVLVVSKPPAPQVAAQLRLRAKAATKPVIYCFLGDQSGPATLDDAALAAVAAVGGTAPALQRALPHDVIDKLKARLAPQQRFVRGLYAGGTLAYESQLLLRQAGVEVASNAPLPGGRRLEPNARSEGNAVIDLGAEEFTRGRPHPMIDARARRARLREEAADPEVAVVLLDFVLGYGAAADPAGDLAKDIATARAEAAQGGRELIVLTSICGTAHDPQNLTLQERTLRDAGALVLPTNAAVARSAALLLLSDAVDDTRTFELAGGAS